MPKSAQSPKSESFAGSVPLSGSGRKFVIGLTIVVLLSWGALAVGFRIWKSNYEGRAAAGRVSAARIRPLVDARPPGVEVWVWEDTVDHAEAMLIALTGSNLVSVSQIQEISARVDRLVDESKKDPAQAIALLRAFWDELAGRAGPVADIYGRPALLRPIAL